MNTNSTATYAEQLEQRVEQLIPNLDTSERLELLATMNADELRGAMAFVLTLYPGVFDKALVSNRAMLDRLIGAMR